MTPKPTTRQIVAIADARRRAKATETKGCEMTTHPYYDGDIWGLDDGAWVAVNSIRVACDPQGDWYIASAEFENGDDATDAELEQLRDMNPEKFADLVRETIDAEAEARAEDNYE